MRHRVYKVSASGEARALPLQWRGIASLAQEIAPTVLRGVAPTVVKRGFPFEAGQCRKRLEEDLLSYVFCCFSVANLLVDEGIDFLLIFGDEWIKCIGVAVLCARDKVLLIRRNILSKGSWRAIRKRWRHTSPAWNSHKKNVP